MKPIVGSPLDMARANSAPTSMSVAIKHNAATTLSITTSFFHSATLTKMLAINIARVVSYGFSYNIFLIVISMCLSNFLSGKFLFTQAK